MNYEDIFYKTDHLKRTHVSGFFLNGRDDRLSLSETELSLGKRMQLSAVLTELELREWCHDVIGADRPLNKKEPT